MLSGFEPKLNVLLPCEPNENLLLAGKPISFFSPSFGAVPGLGASQHIHFSTLFELLVKHASHCQDALFCLFTIDLNTSSGVTEAIGAAGFDAASALLVEGKTVEFPNDN